MQKQHQRQIIKKRLENIDNTNRLSEFICNKLDILLPTDIKLGSYLSINNEVNLTKLHNNKTRDIYYPIIDKNSLLFGNSKKYKFNVFNIKEPVQPRLISLNELFAIILPLSAFDSELNRLGKGKGFYDISLQNYSGLKIGAAFDEQELDKVVTFNHDLVMDLVVTPTRILSLKK
jgi:5-formyltetrahydrofolate cyclo-ligase